MATPSKNQQLKPPKLFQLLMEKQESVPDAFYEFVWQHVFHKEPVETESLAKKLKTDRNICIGKYTYEVAETKLKRINYMSNKHKHDFKCRLEEVGTK